MNNKIDIEDFRTEFLNVLYEESKIDQLIYDLISDGGEEYVNVLIDRAYSKLKNNAKEQA